MTETAARDVQASRFGRDCRANENQSQRTQDRQSAAITNVKDHSETAQDFQPRKIKRESHTDEPWQRFVIVDVQPELDRVENLERAGVNENSAHDNVDDSPNEFHLNSLSILLHPFFPAALENENIFELRFISQAFRNVARRVATFGAAIDDYFLVRRPVRQKLREQLVPAILVQRKCAGHVILRKIIIRPRVHPKGAVTPRPCLIDNDQLRRGNRRLPRNFVAKINSFTDRRQRGERDQDESFSQEAEFHRWAAGDGIAAGVALFTAGATAGGFGRNIGGAPGGAVTITFTRKDFGDSLG